jgi:hypothetical protein
VFLEQYYYEDSAFLQADITAVAMDKTVKVAATEANLEEVFKSTL